MSKASDEVRRSFGESDRKRDAGLVAPKEVVRYDDICYGTEAKWQVLDVYRPKNMDGKVLPVIFSVHGGAWVYGDKNLYQFYCMSLAERGFAVVNFTYRLAPEYQYPAAIEDINLVVTWILGHAREYGFDTEHIFAVGDSAGAHQLGLYTAICTNPEYAKQYSFFVPNDFVPTAIALNCGKYAIDFDQNAEPSLKELMADFLPDKGSKEELELITVVNHVTSKFPPTFLMSAPGDFLKMQAPVMAATLSEKNVPFVYKFYSDSKVELGHVFHCNMKLDAAKKCNDDECNFFKGFL